MADKICLISEGQLAREAGLPRKVLHDHITEGGEVVEGVLERLERLGYIRVVEKNVNGTELCKVLVYENPWDHRKPTRNFSTAKKGGAGGRNAKNFRPTKIFDRPKFSTDQNFRPTKIFDRPAQGIPRPPKFLVNTR